MLDFSLLFSLYSLGIISFSLMLLFLTLCNTAPCTLLYCYLSGCAGSLGHFCGMWGWCLGSGWCLRGARTHKYWSWSTAPYSIRELGTQVSALLEAPGPSSMPLPLTPFSSSCHPEQPSGLPVWPVRGTALGLCLHLSPGHQQAQVS